MVKILVDKENLTKAVRRAVTAVNGGTATITATTDLRRYSCRWSR